MPDKKESRCNRRNMIIGSIIAVVIIGVVVGVSVYFGTRPETVPVVTTEAEESLPSLIKVAPMEATGGALLIEFTKALNTIDDENETIHHYVALQDVDFATDFAEFSMDSEKLALYLTTSANPTMGALTFQQAGRRSMLRHKRALEEALRIGRVNSIDFPFRLPESFFPGDYNGALLVEESDDASTNAVKVASASFSVVVDAERNIGSSQDAASTTQSPPMEDSETTTTNQPPSMEASVPPAVTVAPVVPIKSVEETPPPPVLTSTFVGNRYPGTITIDTVMGFENGAIVLTPRLMLEIPRMPNAPGPYLYLSTRPFEETRNGDLVAETDLFVPIDSGTDQQFNVQGTFDQLLDELGSAQDLNAYANGSFIIWCRPFGVWLGGGPITAA